VRPGVFAGRIAGGLESELSATPEIGSERVGWEDGGKGADGFVNIRLSQRKACSKQREPQ
jgi:hypothetical protein